jgi:[acyl-carrier-protein] S-malonyltransferase
MTLAILCPGQGTQHRDMFALTGEAPAAADVFAAATRALGGTDPRELVRTEDAAMHTNAVGQVLCCTQALAAFLALRDAIGPRVVLAGYSVGELSAWGCADLYAPEELVALAGKRAAAMDAASGPDDGLVFVRGLRRAAIDELCARHDAGIAIVNPGDMVVIGGARADLDALLHDADAAGAAKVGALKVAVASHTRKLDAASPRFRADLGSPAARLKPGLRLLSGIDGTMVTDVAAGLDKLAAQISHTIEWAACLEACVEAGVDAALELGPGTALAGMTSAAYPSVNARSLEDFRTLSGVQAWLARATG